MGSQSGLRSLLLISPLTVVLKCHWSMSLGRVVTIPLAWSSLLPYKIGIFWMINEWISVVLVELAYSFISQLLFSWWWINFIPFQQRRQQSHLPVSYRNRWPDKHYHLCQAIQCLISRKLHNFNFWSRRHNRTWTNKFEFHEEATRFSFRFWILSFS